MSRITLDAAVIARLSDLTSPVEICDGDGKVIGVFRPKLDPAKYGPLEPQISAEEIQRRAESKERRYSTAEVLEHLKRLEQEGR
jgi:hypothetical protein